MKLMRPVLALAFGTALQAQQGIPAPESVLGFRPGDDFRLATYEESIEYFKRLDAASDRLRLLEVGRTSEGRAWHLALVSSPENLANLERSWTSAAGSTLPRWPARSIRSSWRTT
jgi:hypothetical protein